MRVPGRTVALLAVVVGAGAVFLFADQETPRLTGHPGFPTYREYCRRCHGYSGEGKRASRMAGRPVSLVAPAYRDTASVEDVERVVSRGKGKMNGYAAKLTPQQIQAVCRYVLALSGPSAADGVRGEGDP